MKAFFRCFVRFWDAFMLFGIIFGIVLGTLYELVNPGTFEKILSKIGLPITINQFWMIYFVVLILNVITVILHNKFSK